jgi:putative addiction module component (TIGR02574 family)
MESRETLLEKALQLKAQDRFLLIDSLIRSLDEPCENIDSLWVEEAEKRLAAYREGKTVSISFEEVFGEKL